ncbi:MAG: TatD family hydrolase [Actinomycetota bacterium]|nr:TatD family hydrolase [Actinomycetota bacterium]
MWADSHCHVPHEGVGLEVIAEARAAGVTRVVTIGTDAPTSAVAAQVARDHDGVWATVGLHPHHADLGADSLLGVLDAVGPEVVAVGECGLDYFYHHADRAAQREAFAAQIALALGHDLALVIHTRDAWDDTFEVLAAAGVPPRTVFHCFTGGPAEARRSLDVGAWLSFSGIVSFKTAGDVRAAAAMCPLDRVLVETDSPYLAPVPHRGKPNRPALVAVVGEALAAAMGRPVPEVESATWANTAAAFRLPG